MQLLRFVCLSLLMASGICFGAQTNAQTNAIQTVAELRARLAQHVLNPKFQAGTFAVKIVSAKTGVVVFENDAYELMSPASNAKLYTVALALDRLGGDYKIRTSLYSNARPQDGKLAGDLVVYGRGDPTINPRIRGTLAQAVEPLVAALAGAGVSEIGGDLVADESFIRGPEFGSGWTWDDLEFYYGAAISSLTINDNLVGLAIKPGASVGAPCSLELSPFTSQFVISNRTATVAAGEKRTTRVCRQADSNVLFVFGSMPADDKGYTEDVTLRSPAAFFLEQLQSSLAAHKIKLDGKARIVGWLDRQTAPLNLSSMVELGAMESLPMKDIAREVQKPSQNLYTDLLLAHVGEKTRTSQDSPWETSEELGIRELKKFLAGAGVKPKDVHFEEGSGLSRNDLTTANATVALLLHMSRHPSAAAYWDALPVAGVDGSLRNRMKDTAAAGNVRAKTGTLRWAYSLSGDVRTAAGERLIFSIMLNRYFNQDPENATRAELEVIPVMLAEFAGKVDQ